MESFYEKLYYELDKMYKNMKSGLNLKERLR